MPEIKGQDEMIDFPARIDCGDFELVKPAATFENAVRLYDAVNQNRDDLRRFLPWVDKIHRPEDEYDAIKLIARADNPVYLIFVDGRLAGAIDAHAESVRDASIELGYWLGREFWGRGIATRAARAMQDLLFERGINRIAIWVSSDNLPSIAVASRLGFVRDGVMRDAMQIRPDEFQDMIVFSKLKSEWTKGNKNA